MHAVAFEIFFVVALSRVLGLIMSTGSTRHTHWNLNFVGKVCLLQFSFIVRLDGNEIH